MTAEKMSKKFLDPKSVRAFRLLTTTIIYLVGGAFIFSFLEFDSDEALKAEIAQTRHEMQLKYNFSQEDYAELEKAVVTAVPFGGGYQWQFAGAFYFCTVVVTTVGYGHSTPATVKGRLFCMIFALIGIPLSLVMFQSVGERVNTLIGFCLLKFRQCLASYFGIHVLPQIKSKHLLFISLSIGSLTIAIGTIVFHQYEGWTIFNSLYYIVITLSTIGFGDYVPLQTGGRLQKDIGYVFFTLGFILFGLAIFSACINLLVLECMAHNADIVTARSRLRRLLSLRRSTSSFRPQQKTASPISPPAKKQIPTTTTTTTIVPPATVTQPSHGNVQTAGRLSRHYRHSRHSELLEGITHDLKDIRIQKEVEKRDKKFFTDVYELYVNKKPAYFTVRRLPTVYIEHLVHTSPTDVFL